jgi:flagellar hook-associated protein 2
MSSSSTLFTGSSRYAQDFQSVIDRAVAIAALPQQQMKANGATLSSESSALSSLDSVFQSLQSAIDRIDAAAGSSSYGVTSSDQNVSASVGGNASPGTYTVEVTNLGVYTSVMSVAQASGTNRVTDPAQTGLFGSGSIDYTLRLNGGDPITISASNLNDLVSQINAKAGADIQATVVNVGSTDGQANYRLSIQGRHLRSDSIELSAGGTSLLTAIQDGHAATYKVNGADEASSDSRTVEIAPGVTASLQQKSDSGSPTTITVSRSADSVRSALNSLANAYNAVVDELDKNRGENQGALSGQSIVYRVSDVLRQMSNFAGAADFGIELDRSGHMSLNTTTFTSAVQSDLSGVMDWAGTSTSGGFAKAVNDLYQSVEDDQTGILKSAISENANQIETNTQRIGTEQTRLDDLQTTLQERMAAADALIASLEQQATYITNLFDSINSANSNSK